MKTNKQMSETEIKTLAAKLKIEQINRLQGIFNLLDEARHLTNEYQAWRVENGFDTDSLLTAQAKILTEAIIRGSHRIEEVI